MTKKIILLLFKMVGKSIRYLTVTVIGLHLNLPLKSGSLPYGRAARIPSKI